MTGSLRVFTRAAAAASRTITSIIEFENGVVLRYRDPRRFGAMLWSPARRGEHPLLASLGPEPFAREFDADYLYRATRRRRRGNQARADGQPVWSSASATSTRTSRCFAPASGPRAPPNRVSRATVRAARRRRARDADRRDREGRQHAARLRRQRGEPGYFQLDYYVYGREGEPCRVCGATDPSRAAGRAGDAITARSCQR